MKKILIVLGALSIIAVGVYFAASFSGGNKYHNIADKYMGYLNEGNHDLSYALLSTSKKSTVSAEAWKTYVEKLSGKFPPTCDNITQEKIVDPEKAYAKGSDPVRFVCDFKLENSDYRIMFVFINESSNILIDDIQGYSML